ncbi:PIN domain-containing protein [Variovorax sp. W2I14]|uniref:PIN domain-containing protein n=1 Tax=Variovorax sp. W2I14 TaxID=3042290 RepID=UPI003D2020EF
MFGLPALPRHGLNMETGVHLLIDLENVQPSPLEVEAWLGEAGEAWAFYGPHQLKRKAAFEADSPRSTLVPIARPGANSLDFHLVFYLGYLAAKHPECRFVVLAKDTDYGPPIAHTNPLAFSVERLKPHTSQFLLHHPAGLIAAVRGREAPNQAHHLVHVNASRTFSVPRYKTFLTREELSRSGNALRACVPHDSRSICIEVDCPFATEYTPLNRHPLWLDDSTIIGHVA